MAIKQYIGARYVPVYVGVWSASNNYEPLSIVTDGTGNSWTSRKLVPAGTPLQEGEYWALTGVYSAQLLQLDERVTTAEGKIAGLEHSEESLSGRMNLLDKHRIVCITDSYGTHSINNWCTLLARAMGLIQGSSFFYYAEGSTGFEHEGLQGHTFKTLLESNAANISDPETITEVIILGGTNDFGYFTTAENLRSAIADCCDYIHATYPNAKVYLAFAGYILNMPNTVRANYLSTLREYTEYCAANRAIFINAGNVMHLPENREDRMHPNDTGNAKFASLLYSKIVGGCDYFTYGTYFVSFQAPGSNLNLGGGGFDISVNDDLTIVRFRLTSVTGDQTAGAGSDTLIAKYSALEFPIIPVIFTMTPLVSIRNKGTQEYLRVPAPLDFKVANDVVTISTRMQVPTQTIDYIQIPWASFIVPTQQL